MMKVTQHYFTESALALQRVGLQSHAPKLLVGVLLAVAMAYLVTAGLWMVALALLAVVPGFVLLQKYPLLGLLGWLLAAQFLMETETSALRMIYWIIHRALPPATVAIIVLSSLLKINRRRLPHLSWPELAMLGYLVVTQFSIVYLSQDLLGTTYWLYDRVFVPMCLYLIVRLLAPTEQTLKPLVVAAFIVTVVQCGVGILSWVAPSLIPSMWRGVYIGDRTVGTLVNPGVYTSTLAFTSLLILHGALTQSTRLWRTVYVAAFLVANYCIFISFTRSSWLGALIVAGALLFVYPRFMPKLFVISALLMAIIGGSAAGSGLFSDQLEWARQRFYSEESEESALSRLPIYYAAARMFAAKPLFGWGFSNFDRYDREFQGRVGDLVNPEKDHASHNLYLTLLAEQGLVGFLLYVAPLLWYFIRSLVAAPRMPKDGFWSRKLLAILWLTVIYFFIINNFFNVIVVYSLGIWWLTLALIAVLVESFLNQQDTETNSLKSRLLHRFHGA